VWHNLWRPRGEHETNHFIHSVGHLLHLFEYGTRASKDFLTVEENNRLENYGEDTINQVWARATKIAEEVFR
jgi:hypothetical protein